MNNTTDPTPQALAVATSSGRVPADVLMRLSQIWISSAGSKKEKAITYLNELGNPNMAKALYEQAHILEDCARELSLLVSDFCGRQSTPNAQG
jgi:hypothetical protein